MSIRPTVTLVGNIGRIDDLKFSKGGKAFIRHSLAVGERVFEDGKWVDGEASWYDAVAFGYTAEAIADTCTKGTKVIVVGHITRKKWEGKDGVQRDGVQITVEEIGVIPFKKQQRTARRDQFDNDEAPY